ncbi:Cu(I)-responsive transcriptional regulator [Roseicella aerolata]|uniref:Cu(I)-responsive transcriptional regulator n=1 Tax=Roseicella aerolata TaxID=2883479 RepID=A0A9X1IHV3_9PROT|nr:Cu(I)-responsive transcriptional regulator [Roseicella aerolata]MCB4824489.1 Cu(I)-responsive transcriptional regulator [Roseicella aerolata]
MNIGQASATSGVSAKMIRYYEDIGLMPKAGRTEAGYRVYTAADVNTLRFIRRARDLGMPIERIRLLVSLWQDRARSSGDVKRIALEHVSELRTKIAELTAMCEALEGLAHACHGDHRPDCPILEDLEAGGQQAPARVRRRRRIDAGQSQPGATA